MQLSFFGFAVCWYNQWQFKRVVEALGLLMPMAPHKKPKLWIKITFDAFMRVQRLLLSISECTNAIVLKKVVLDLNFLHDASVCFQKSYPWYQITYRTNMKFSTNRWMPMTKFTRISCTWCYFWWLSYWSQLCRGLATINNLFLSSKQLVK